MDWEDSINRFKEFLILQKSLSPNTVEAYERDIKKLSVYFSEKSRNKLPLSLQLDDLELFIQYIAKTGISRRSQARLISVIRAFYKFLIMDDLMDDDPSQLLEAPKISLKLPDVLSVEEINSIIGQIDHSKPGGARTRAIIELLYGCGLRVSELTQLHITDLYLEQGFVKILGKGNKERLVPIGDSAINYLQIYIEEVRKHQSIAVGFENYIFLNLRGKSLSRISVFTMIKQLVSDAGIHKTVSPHTFRHSFATHLVEGGANLRAVQEMLGHESITTTEIYTHLSKDFLRSELIDFHPFYRKKNESK